MILLQVSRGKPEVSFETYDSEKQDVLDEYVQSGSVFIKVAG